jgi:RNA polymerase sigma-70 factor (ECF subfamily)
MEAILFFADPSGRSLTTAAIPAIAAPADGGSRDRIQSSTAMDEQQFQLLYDATARPIYAYLVGVTRHPDIADDVLQETYFRFLQRHPAGMPPAETRPYLFRIATNLLRDRWRGKQESQWPEDLDPSRACDIDTQLDVRHVMQGLKPKERELLWLAYVEGMTHQEIAIATGLTALSVRPLLFRARKKAASLLRPEEKSL